MPLNGLYHKCLNVFVCLLLHAAVLVNAQSPLQFISNGEAKGRSGTANNPDPGASNVPLMTGMESPVLIPEILNYPKNSYDAGRQNRAIAQDRDGLLYFANDDGMLVFDGTYWKTYPLPNKSIVRSLALAGGRIYVGGQHEIGYFGAGRNGVMTYQSLNQLIPPAEQDFSDVWQVISYEQDVFFRSSKRIFRLHNNTITAFNSIDWRFLGISQGVLIAQQYESGLMMFTAGKWMPYKTPFDFAKNRMIIKSVTEFSDRKSLLTTLKSGMFIIESSEMREFKTKPIAAIAANMIHASCALDSNRFIIATKLGGYYIMDINGNVLQHITKKDGLQTNTIHAVFADRERNIWLGLDNGIDLVISNSAISHIDPSFENKSPGYSAEVYKGRLYLGTNVGLFSIPLLPGNNLNNQQGEFRMVKKSNGIVWGLSVINDQLLMGRSDGAYRVSNDVSVPIDTTSGFWSFHLISSSQAASKIIAGTYNGINQYYFADAKFSDPKIQTVFESARYVVVSENQIWAANPYRGLFRISVNDTGGLVNTAYIDKGNILSAGHNHLFLVGNKMMLLTKKGIYEYDQSLQDFRYSTFFNKMFPGSDVSYLREDAAGNIWFIQDKKAGVIDMSGQGKVSITMFPELNNRILGNDEEFIYPLNKNNVLVSGDVGFYHIDFERYKNAGSPMNVLFRSVLSTNRKDSTLFGGYRDAALQNTSSVSYGLPAPLAYKWNAIRFEYSAAYYAGPVEYSCRLVGFEEEFSPWVRKAERSYNNLPPGDYVFEVKARNSRGVESPVNKLSFTVAAPWYRTWFAWFIYLALVIMLLTGLYRHQHKRYLLQSLRNEREQQLAFMEERQKLLDNHQLEREKNEKEIIRLENIRLESEIRHNNSQLASNTMTLLQKKELLTKIREGIMRVQEETETEQKTRNIRRIIKLINEELEMTDDWDKFSLYFDRVNNEFLKNLKQKHPSLTATDLKLCAYLRLNLSTKEIAELLNLSIRGVESSRYRLRKKMDIVNDLTIFEYLESVGAVT